MMETIFKDGELVTPIDFQAIRNRISTQSDVVIGTGSNKIPVDGEFVYKIATFPIPLIEVDDFDNLCYSLPY